MWMPRIKIHIMNNNRFSKDMVNKWNYLRKINGKDLLYRYTLDNDVEFVLCFYKNKSSALTIAKRLYFLVLYYGYKCNLQYYLGDINYNLKIGKDKSAFFCTKSMPRNNYGLMIYEVDNIDEYDLYYKEQAVEFNSPQFEFMTLIEDLKTCDIVGTYDKQIQEIFHLVSISENIDNGLAILILCQILERLGKRREKSQNVIKVINDCKDVIKHSIIDFSEKDSLISSLDGLKYDSSRSKIRKLVEKYNKEDYIFDKNEVLNKSYTFRSKVIHGEDPFIHGNVILYESYLKQIVLDTFYEWVKLNK